MAGDSIIPNRQSDAANPLFACRAYASASSAGAESSGGGYSVRKRA